MSTSVKSRHISGHLHIEWCAIKSKKLIATLGDLIKKIRSTLCLKIVPTFKLSATLSNLTDFQNFCNAGKRMKFATKPM